jgi:hypothetical protein
MAKTWVLDTETKGTGANMVPLEAVLRRQGAERRLDTVSLAPQRRPVPAASPQAPAPLRFRLVDVLGARELARDVGVQAAVRILEDMRTVLDARVYVWLEDRRRWRLLTLEEHKLLWQFRGRDDEQSAVAERDGSARLSSR